MLLLDGAIEAPSLPTIIMLLATIDSHRGELSTVSGALLIFDLNKLVVVELIVKRALLTIIIYKRILHKVETAVVNKQALCQAH